MTQDRLARLIGKHSEEISRYKSGVRTPGLLTIVEAAFVLHGRGVERIGDLIRRC